MRKLIVAAAAAAMACPLAAQSYEVFTDYVPSTEVWNVTMVRVNPNRVDDYLQGLEQTWWSACEIGKKLGQIMECGIYWSENAATRDFNMMLVVKSPSAATGDPDPEMFRKFQAEMRAKLDEAKQDQIVDGYEELRSFWGEMTLRRIDFK